MSGRMRKCSCWPRRLESPPPASSRKKCDARNHRRSVTAPAHASRDGSSGLHGAAQAGCAGAERPCPASPRAFDGFQRATPAKGPRQHAIRVAAALSGTLSAPARLRPSRTGGAGSGGGTECPALSCWTMPRQTQRLPQSGLPPDSPIPAPGTPAPHLVSASAFRLPTRMIVTAPGR